MEVPVASLVVILFFTTNVASRVPTSENHTLMFLNDVLTALEKVTEFFVEDYADVNMDGLFGVRLGQGGLIGTLDDCSKSGFNCPPELVDHIEDINDRMTDFGEKALPYIEQQDARYYTEYLPTITAPYMVKYIPETLVGSLEHIDTSLAYDFKLAGDCFAYVMGTSTEKDKVSPACTVTDDCWQFMTRKGTVGYHTTHQLLYFIYLEHTGCQDVVEERCQRLNGTCVRDLQKYFCEMIYLDASSRIRNWKMESDAEDLLLEQITLCGVLGFQNFVNETWIRMAITWQTPRGCFTTEPTLIKIDKQITKTEKAMEDLLSQKEKGHLDQVTEDNIEKQLALLDPKLKEAQLALKMEYIKINTQKDMIPTRKLMTEHIMDGDCFSHKTGLGFATLAITVRSLVGELYGKN